MFIGRGLGSHTSKSIYQALSAVRFPREELFPPPPASPPLFLLIRQIIRLFQFIIDCLNHEIFHMYLAWMKDRYVRMLQPA
jgi:hypothetical protein